MEGQVPAAPETSSLCSGRERADEPQVAAHRLVDQPLQHPEEFRRAVREGVGPERAECQRVDIAETAPDRGLDREQEVAAGEIDRLIGRLETGTSFPPVLQWAP